MDYDTLIRSVEHAQVLDWSCQTLWRKDRLERGQFSRSSKMRMASAIRIRFCVLWVRTGVASRNRPRL